jgi:hypothetical protein
MRPRVRAFGGSGFNFYEYFYEYFCELPSGAGQERVHAAAHLTQISTNWLSPTQSGDIVSSFLRIPGKAISIPA